MVKPHWFKTRFENHISYNIIIFSTNIAETSITIPDVAYVIDSGFVKYNDYNEALKASAMVEDWTSKSNVTQRSGRAGRTKSGQCWHLYRWDFYFFLILWKVSDLQEAKQFIFDWILRISALASN